MATQHADLTEADWAKQGRDRQILAIAAEMFRARKRLALGEFEHVHLVYERVLNLVDLTVAVHRIRSFRRELLRWREVVGALYVAAQPSSREHDLALAVLLTFSRDA